MRDVLDIDGGDQGLDFEPNIDNGIAPFAVSAGDCALRRSCTRKCAGESLFQAQISVNGGRARRV